MKIPLKIEVKSNKLLVVRNKSIIWEKLPMKPYIIAKSPNLLELLGTNSKVHKIKNIDFDDNNFKEINSYKIEFDNVKVMNELLDKCGYDKFYMNYIKLLSMVKPEFISERKQINNFDILYFDIETLTTGNSLEDRFLDTANTHPIIALGLKYNEEDIYIIKKYEPNEVYPDKKILLEFSRIIQDLDPDIISGFNSTSFDIPYIIKRCDVCGIDSNFLGRFKTYRPMHYIKQDKDGRDVNYIYLPGRVHFDIYDSVKGDQSLSGIKNKKMKTVAKWMKLDNIVEIPDEIANTGKLMEENPERLYQYLNSDVNITYHLGKSYLSNHIYLAEYLGVDLNSVITANPSYHSDIIAGRNLLARNFIPFKSNQRRNYQLNGRFEAALVGIMQYCPNCHKKIFIRKDRTVKCPGCGKDKLTTRNTISPGFREKLWKVDAVSYYPSTIISFLLSPETVRIVKIINWPREKYKDNDYKNRRCEIKSNDKYHYILIPDAKLYMDIIIRIDRLKEGYLPRKTSELFQQKNNIKELLEYSHSSIEEIESLKSQYSIVKVLLNSLFGYCGNPHTMFGDYGVAIAIVGLCRTMMAMIIDELGDKVVEVDTDGLIVDEFVEPKLLDDLIAKWIKEKFGFKSYINFELEEFEQGYIYAMKNYAIRKLDKDDEEKMILHGVAFKSSRHSNIYTQAMDRLLKAVLYKENNIVDIVDTLKDINAYNMSDFILSTKISKPLSEYIGGKNQLQYVLGSQAEKITNRKIEPGAQIYYYKTKNGYKIATKDITREDLDDKFYFKQIDKVCSILGINIDRQRTLTF